MARKIILVNQDKASYEMYFFWGGGEGLIEEKSNRPFQRHLPSELPWVRSAVTEKVYFLSKKERGIGTELSIFNDRKDEKMRIEISSQIKLDSIQNITF